MHEAVHIPVPAPLYLHCITVFYGCTLGTHENEECVKDGASEYGICPSLYQSTTVDLHCVYASEHTNVRACTAQVALYVHRPFSVKHGHQSVSQWFSVRS